MSDDMTPQDCFPLEEPEMHHPKYMELLGMYDKKCGEVWAKDKQIEELKSTIKRLGVVQIFNSSARTISLIPKDDLDALWSKLSSAEAVLEKIAEARDGKTNFSDMAKMAAELLQKWREGK